MGFLKVLLDLQEISRVVEIEVYFAGNVLVCLEKLRFGGVYNYW